MAGKKKNQFFSNHSKSSAAVVTLGLHALLAIIAFSFVAVTVITKDDQKFEAKQVTRPRMTLKKLQVPVKIKKSPPKPKLRKRIVVNPNVNRDIPDIKMPEISGIKGGMGNAGGTGLGGLGASIGFSMPEFNLFGIKGKGERVFLILDAQGYIMVDAYGGIPAYNVLKDELLTLLEGLNPTTLFNICVWDGPGASIAFKKMVPASKSNLKKARNWLEPLNTVKSSNGGHSFGLGTLGSGGYMVEEDYAEIEPLKVPPRGPLKSMLSSMQQQADTVFYLTNGNGAPSYQVEAADDWDAGDRRDWERATEKAKKLLEEENKDREKKGIPPRVLPGKSLVFNYFPNAKPPPDAVSAKYTVDEMTEAMRNARRQWQDKNASLIGGLSNNKVAREYSFNAIQIVTKDNTNDGSGSFLDIFTKENNGKFRTLVGLDAIDYASTKTAPVE